MNRLARVALPALVAMVMTVAAPCSWLFGQDAAQSDEPFAVVAFSGLDAATGSLGKLLTAAGAEQEAALVAAAPVEQLKGIDGARPWGMLWSATADQPRPLVFAPIASLDEFLTSPAFQAAPIPPMEKLEDGVTQVNTPVPVFLKEHNGWLFGAQEAAALASLPDDPTPLLGGLEKQYDVAVRLYVQRVPESLRQLLKAQLEGAGGAPDGPPAADPFGASLLQDDPFGGGAPEGFGDANPFGMPGVGGAMGAAVIDGVFANLDEVTLGLKLDGDAEKATLDVTATVVESSPAAARFAALEGLKSDHAGLLLPGSMVAMHATVPLLPTDAEALAAGVESLVAMSEAGGDPAAIADEAARQEAVRQQEMAELAKRLVLTTIRSGKIDGGIAMFAKPGDTTLIYGGKAANAMALREVMIDAVRQAQKEAGIPQDQFERIDYKGYRFVIVNGIKTANFDKPGDAGALPGEESEGPTPQEMFGEEVQIVLALNEGDHYLAMGTNAVDQVKAVIDASQAAAAQPAMPFTLSIGLQSALAFGADAEMKDISPEVEARIKALDGADRIMLRVAPAGRGATLRLELERQPLLAFVILAVEGIKQGINNGPPGGLDVPGGFGPPGGQPELEPAF